MSQGIPFRHSFSEACMAFITVGQVVFQADFLRDILPLSQGICYGKQATW